MTFTDLDGLARVAEACGWTAEKKSSFPFPRAFGKIFRYNEVVLVARTPDA